MLAVIAAFLNPLLMIATPMLLGSVLAQRLKAEWRLFGLGMVSFVGSQILHLPFNALVLGPLMKTWGLQPTAGNWGLGLVGGLVGLSAGVFEELARYVVYRRWLPKAHRWRDGLMFGAGHGGCEAIILGLLAFYSFLQLFMLRGVDLGTVVKLDQIVALRGALQSYWSTPSYGHLLPSLERAAALCIHLALSLMVLQAVARRRYNWLGLAVFWHALVNAVAVFALQTWGAYVAEGVVTLTALVSVAIIYRLRKYDIDEAGETTAPPAPAAQQAYSETASDIRPDHLEQTRFD